MFQVLVWPKFSLRTSIVMSLSTWCGEGVSNGVGTCGVYNRDFFPVQTFTKQKICKRALKSHISTKAISLQMILTLSVSEAISSHYHHESLVARGLPACTMKRGSVRACTGKKHKPCHQPPTAFPHGRDLRPSSILIFRIVLPSQLILVEIYISHSYLPLLRERSVLGPHIFFPTSPSQPKCNEISIPM